MVEVVHRIAISGDICFKDTLIDVLVVGVGGANQLEGNFVALGVHDFGDPLVAELGHGADGVGMGVEDHHGRTFTILIPHTATHFSGIGIQEVGSLDAPGDTLGSEGVDTHSGFTGITEGIFGIGVSFLDGAAGQNVVELVKHDPLPGGFDGSLMVGRTGDGLGQHIQLFGGDQGGLGTAV